MAPAFFVARQNFFFFLDSLSWQPACAPSSLLLAPVAAAGGKSSQEKENSSATLKGKKLSQAQTKGKKEVEDEEVSEAHSFVLGWWLVEAVVVLLSVLCFQPVSVLCSGSSCSCRCWHHSSHHLLLVVVLPSCVPACSAPPKCWTRSTDNGGEGKAVLLSAPPIGPSVCVFAVHCALSSDGGDDDDSDDRPAATSPQQQQHRRQSVCV